MKRLVNNTGNNTDQKEEPDELLDYLPTEHLDGGFNPKVHPHCLTGAKGYETTFMNADFKEDDEPFEDLIDVERQYQDGTYRDSDQLLQCGGISDDISQEVCKLALDTEEDEEEQLQNQHTYK